MYFLCLHVFFLPKESLNYYRTCSRAVVAFSSFIYNAIFKLQWRLRIDRKLVSRRELEGSAS